LRGLGASGSLRVVSDLIRRDRDGPVAILTFDDPERRNAMTEAMGLALREAVAELGRDAGVRAVVLTGAGSAFSAGGDLAMIEEKSRAGRARPDAAQRAAHRDFMRRFYGLFLSVRELPCPSVAALNGAAVGAGLCVALACDLRVAARDARLSLNFVRLGIHPGMGATWTLPRLVGTARAAELLLTGRPVDGEEAERIGLVNRAVARDEVLPEALALARSVAAGAARSVRGAREALARSPRSTLEEQLDFEAAQQALDYEGTDLAEGLAAARERRDPHFTGN
jgi:enoyl-CoA hydratase/carnithine racemase